MNLKNTVTMLLLLGGVVSCVKAPEQEDTETTPEAVLESVSDTWGTIDPFSLKVNDFVEFETTQKVETNPNPFYTLREGITVKERNDTQENGSSITRYKFNYQFYITKGSQNTPQSTKEVERGYRRATSSAIESNATNTPLSAELKIKSLQSYADDSTMVLGFERAGYLAGVCFNDDEEQEACIKEGYDSCERKCVNLKVEEIMRPVPDLVKAQTNCGGFANCTWRTKTISFDLIQTFKKGAVSESLRASFWSSFVPELPFLSRMTDFCIRQLVTVKTADPNDAMNGRKVLVNNCTSLTNFKPAP